MSEAARLKRLINGFKTHKTFDLTHRVNNIIGLRYCRRSASLCSSNLLKCQKLVFNSTRLESTPLNLNPCRSAEALPLYIYTRVYFDLNAL